MSGFEAGHEPALVEAVAARLGPEAAPGTVPVLLVDHSIEP